MRFETHYYLGTEETGRMYTKVLETIRDVTLLPYKLVTEVYTACHIVEIKDLKTNKTFDTVEQLQEDLIMGGRGASTGTRSSTSQTLGGTTFSQETLVSNFNSSYGSNGYSSEASTAVKQTLDAAPVGTSYYFGTAERSYTSRTYADKTDAGWEYSTKRGGITTQSPTIVSSSYLAERLASVMTFQNNNPSRANNTRPKSL